MYLKYFTPLLFLLTSCGPKVIYEFENKVDEQWAKNKALIFKFDVSDTTSLYDMNLNVTVTNEYKYQNIYVEASTTFPNNKIVKDIVSLELSKSNGESYGKCNSSECKIPILFQEKIRFPMVGKYQITISQKSRDEILSGIKLMKLKITEADKS